MTSRTGTVTTLVVGATGATGRLLLTQLLGRGRALKVIVRSPEKLPPDVRKRVSVIHANLLELSAADLAGHVRGCGAVASCLGHTISLRGIYGPPHKLVTEATRRLHEAVSANEPTAPVKFVLMNTAGNSNRDLNEPVSRAQGVVTSLIRHLVPPHADNEAAADYLRAAKDAALEWSVVRPDTLTSEDRVSAYEVHASPTRSAIFNPGKTSRINVAHFMAELLTNEATWDKWKGQMPVIYNKTAT